MTGQATSKTFTETREIKLAHSPDSDDAFMFYALATHKVNTPGYKYTHVLNDIQTLNAVSECNVAPPSTVNSNEVKVRIRPCLASEKEICKIAPLPAECENQVSPPSSVVRKRPPVPAA